MYAKTQVSAHAKTFNMNFIIHQCAPNIYTVPDTTPFPIVLTSSDVTFSLSFASGGVNSRFSSSMTQCPVMSYELYKSDSTLIDPTSSSELVKLTDNTDITKTSLSVSSINTLANSLTMYKLKAIGLASFQSV